MNSEQVRNLKEDDKIVCTWTPALTVGKQYEVKKTSVGRMIIDDNGIGRFLYMTYQCFFKTVEKEK